MQTEGPTPSKRPSRAKQSPAGETPERLSAGCPERPLCQQCDLFAHCKTPFSKPFVPKGWTGKLLIIGEAFGEDEDTRTGRPFTGQAGQLLRRLWREAGYEDRDVALCNAVRCRPRSNATPTMRQVRSCRPFVLRSIAVLAPKYVIGVGGTALRSLTNSGNANVTKSRGKILEVPVLLEVGTGESGQTRLSQAYCTYHPAAVIRGANELRQRIVDDLKALRADSVPYPEFRCPNMPVYRRLAIDTEYAPDGTLLTLAVSDGKTAFAQEGGLTAPIEEINKAEYLVGHSIAGDLRYLNDLGCLKSDWITGRKVLDSLLLARMVDENLLSYELETLLLNHLKVKPWKWETHAYDFSYETGKKKKDVDARRWPEEARRRRCALDAWASAKLVEILGPKLSAGGHWPLVRFTHRVANVLDRVSLSGAIVDLERLGKHRQDLESVLQREGDLLSRAATQAGMTEFSPTNDNHLRELLYNKLGLEPQGRTPKRLPSVDKKNLLRLNHPITRQIIDYNKAEKLYSVNVYGLAKFLRPCGGLDNASRAVLAFHINPLGARTGRRSSSHPNSQNWTAKIRGIVCSRFVGGKIGAFDYAKLEPRLIAWEAKDENLMRVFTTGNGYVDIARALFHKEVPKEGIEYRATKAIVLGVHYNLQTDKMALDLWDGVLNDQGELVTIRFSTDYDDHWRTVDELRRSYLRTYPGLMEYQALQERYLLRHQSAVSATGRTRNLPIPDGRNTKGYGHALNMAINFPIQSLAADVTGSALVDVEAALLREHRLTYPEYYQLLLDEQKYLLTNSSGRGTIYPISQIINEVHDELTVDLAPDHLKRDTELIIETMRAVPSLHKILPSFTCPLDVSARIGSHWGQQE